MAILLVDDNLINIGIERMMFESSGVTVDSANSGEEAVELARNNNYAMIVMDIQMPGIDGFTASERIREFDKNVPIIALSANEISTDDPNFIRAKMNGALVKPMTLLPIQQLLERYLQLTKEDRFLWRRETDKIFDYEALCSLVSDEKTAKNILLRFLSEHREDCTKIQNYISDGDYDKASALLHDIVGVSGNLYCHRLYETASILRTQLKLQQCEKLPVFISVWNDTIGAISEHCNKLVYGTPKAEESTADWETLLADFVAFAFEFDVETTTIFNENVSEFKANLPEEMYEKLKDDVNHYNYLDVQELMEGYRNV